MRRRIALASVLSAFAFASIGAAPAYAAADATIDVMWAFRVARGAAVDVSYGITCPAGYQATVTVSLDQVRKDGLRASGTVTEQLTCAGTGVLEMGRVTASVTGAPFQAGKATLAILATGCDDQDCFAVPVNQDIHVQN
ncbi:hypothetical protein JIG36_48440 [Actinoplanes sp. LDG1-06]|uniref:Uncharacterized protein n=1 Tax=Paractinoplanes ovalisporus TaxID=2810368 RepID=A0ABS2AU03_9ACTN|nr:hypothetical protein [Actinoplanes ovalisporus]MBM2623353.1 hypothetical protein [Actinoplanes ovalisporus]